MERIFIIIIVYRITPDICSHKEDLSKRVGGDILKTIDRQRELEEKCEELLGKRAQLKGLANKSKYAEVQVEIKEVNHSLRLITKHLCQSLLENPNVKGNLKKVNRERTFLENLLSDTIVDVQNGQFTSLIKQIEAENKERNRVEELEKQEKETREAVQKLEENLRKEESSHQREMKEKNEIINQLKEELREVTRKTVDQYIYARKETKAKINTMLYEYQTEETLEDKRLIELKNEKEKEILVHEETIKFLTNKQKQYEDLVNEWNVKYTADLAEMDKTIKVLNISRDEDLSKLKLLQGRFDKDTADRVAKEEDIRKHNQFEIMKAAEFEEQNQSAIKIQKCYREYKAFKEMKAKLLPKKKKRRRKKSKKPKF